MLFPLRKLVPSWLSAISLFAATALPAALPNAWHVPDNTIVSGSGGTTPTMRNPRFEFGNTGTVRVFSGVQKLANGFGTADQNGGTVYYKSASQGTWSTVALSYHHDSGNDQYWFADLTLANLVADDVIQYYILLTFTPGPADNAFIYGGGDKGGALVTANNGAASAAPFTVRNRAAYIFHAGNRVLNGATTQFWAKVGYVPENNDVTKKWVTNGAVYYTTDGSTPAGSLGVPSGTTQVATMGLDHLEADPSVAGNAMWWRGDVMNLPTFTTIKYKLGLWNAANNEEKFADYNAQAEQVFSYTVGTVGDPSLTVNGVEANYTTTHTYINEVTGTSTNFTFNFAPHDPQVDPATVQVFTNLNRRDFATLKYTDVNGVWTEEGINPPSGDVVSTDDLHYYRAYPMSGSLAAGFTVSLAATKTGAYRATARYKQTGQSTWIYYSSNGRRDHALVISPETARNMVMFELNAMTVESQGTTSALRSTFVDLYDGPGARPYNSVSSRFNLDYIRNLGANWLWFQPIHPAGYAGRQIDPVTGAIFETGSPYAVKNFFEVSPLLAKSYTPSAIYNPNDAGENAGRAAAMVEFQGFVAAADAAGVSVMLDAPFNHTAYDGELSVSGVKYIAPGTDPRALMLNVDTRFYSRNADYCQRASLVSGQGPAVAPDRGDFGKFGDVYDVFFGRYSALVCQNPQDDRSYLNENDAFFYVDANWTSKDRNINIDGQLRDINVTQNTWKYFSDYILFWLDQTGCPAGTSLADQAYKGIDGLRADFGQGLPPQCWEYMINKARSRKWAFVFMAESLDGGAVTYRSGRHFDVLNENIVFPYQNAATASDYRNLYETRRNAYGQALVLLNNTSHDEENYLDPFQAFIRFSTAGSVDGVPLIFMGQELGISRTFGFDRYETNFGKQIAHFKKYNSLQPIFAPGNRTYALDQLYPIYAAIGQARQFSRALRSSNRYFLDLIGGSQQPSVFSVAKYEAANASPNFSDVVFAFTNLDRNNNQGGNFNVNITQSGSNLFGIKAARTYNVKNIAAYTAIDGTRRDQYLIPGNISGTNLLNNGLFVLLKKVPSVDSAWATDPFEAQYLKLYDVTPPPAPAAPTSPSSYVAGHSVTFNWSAVTDPDGGVSSYVLRIGTTPGASDVFGPTDVGNVLTYTRTNVPYGVTLYATIAAVSNAAIVGPQSATSAAVAVLDPAADDDGDGVNNANEIISGTNPLDRNSVLKVTSTGKNAGTVTVTWSSVAGVKYVIDSTPDLSAGFSPLSGTITASGVSTSYDDVGATGVQQFYRVRVVP